jgi:hypothetical protein
MTRSWKMRSTWRDDNYKVRRWTREDSKSSLPITSPECNHYISPLGVGWIKSRLANSSLRGDSSYIRVQTHTHLRENLYCRHSVIPCRARCECRTTRLNAAKTTSSVRDENLETYLKWKQKREFSPLNPLLVFHCNHNLYITLAIFILQRSALLNPCCYQINFNVFFHFFRNSF